jgi:CBS domain-containing protein
MIACPYCGSENTEGSDICDRCQHSLTDMSRPRPSSAVERGLLKDRIESLASQPPLTVGPEDSVGGVLKKMVAKSIGCVMVVDGDQLLGIFSERDALMKLNVDAARMADQPIRSVMTANPITLAAKDKIVYALHKMNVGGYRHVPILTKGQLTGVISIRDILAYLTQRLS